MKWIMLLIYRTLALSINIIVGVFFIPTTSELAYAFSRCPAISSCASFRRKLANTVSMYCDNPDIAGTHLYQIIVGATVPRCHKLCASRHPHHGGKSSSSKLIAMITHATTKPGHIAHVRWDFLYLSKLNQLHMIFWMTPTTTLAAMLYV
jgi:hypothetical protein